MASSLTLLARKLERFRISFTSNGRNDHVTVFTLYLPCIVFSFVVELSSFALFSPTVCTNFIKKTNYVNLMCLPFVVNAVLNPSIIFCVLSKLVYGL